MNPTSPPSSRAPVYSAKHWRRNPVRIPPPGDLLGLQNGKPFWIPIFDTSRLFGAGGTLPINSSAEDNFQLTADFVWVGRNASSSQLGVNPGLGPFTIQLMRQWTDDEGNIQSYRFQKTPISARGWCGVSPFNQAFSPIPFYLRKPVLLRAGTELLCRVQSTINVIQQIQVVLFGYIEG